MDTITFLLSYINERAEDATTIVTPLATSTSTLKLKRFALDESESRFGDDFSELEWEELNCGVYTLVIDEDGGNQMYQIESIKSL